MTRCKFTPALMPLEGRALLAPVLTPISDVFGVERQTLTIAVQATDANPVTFALSQAPSGAIIDPQTGIFKYTTPTNTESALVTVVATAADGSANETFRLYVFDSPPSVFGEINAVTVVGQQFAGNGSFSSPDAGSFSATQGFGDSPEIDPLPLVGDTFSFSHVYQTAGTYVVSIRVIDPQGYSGFGYFSVTVLPVVSPNSTPLPTPAPSPTPLPAPPVAPVTVTPTPPSVIIVVPPGSIVTVKTPKHPKHPVPPPKHHVVHKLTPLQTFLNAHRVI
jgi:hypothetical protein